MNKITSNKKDTAKILLATVFSIAAAALVFQGITKFVLASELKKTEAVPVSYQSSPVSVSKQENKKENEVNQPDGYVKPNYTITDNDLPYYQNMAPTSLDLSKQEAADIGVQALWTIFALDLNGKEIEMSYTAAHDGYRAVWDGIWWIDGKNNSIQNYFFSIDATTGEVLSVLLSRVLKETADTGYDAALEQNANTSSEQNANEYEALARTTAEKYQVVHGDIASVTYEGQGATNNEPDISFKVVGTNGERAQLNFSRYDKTLLGVTYEAGMKNMDVAEKNAEEFSNRAAEYFKEHPDATTYEEMDKYSTLIPQANVD